MKRHLLLVGLLALLYACERQPVEPVAKDTVKDHEGNEYEIKTYGSQTWMVENMKATTTKEGKNILKCPANGQFSYEEPVAYYFCDNEEYTTNGRGCLYNFAAAREICPDGWHLPSVDDWNTFEDYVAREYTGMYNGDTVTAAKAIASKKNWNTCDTLVGAPGYHVTTNNTSGFNLLPVGNYITLQGSNDNPDFINRGWYATLWTSSLSSYSYESAYTVRVCSYSDTCATGGSSMFQAFSVRCVKDSK